jgi:hypothetical protein
MTTFSHIFHSTRELAISQGRRPVVCYLGPDMEEGFAEYCDNLVDYVVMDPSDLWIVTLKPGDLGTLQGIRLRKMDLPGIAFITVPAPESGFDTL